MSAVVLWLIVAVGGAVLTVVNSHGGCRYCFVVDTDSVGCKR